MNAVPALESIPLRDAPEDIRELLRLYRDVVTDCAHPKCNHHKRWLQSDLQLFLSARMAMPWLRPLSALETYFEDFEGERLAKDFSPAQLEEMRKFFLVWTRLPGRLKECSITVPSLPPEKLVVSSLGRVMAAIKRGPPPVEPIKPTDPWSQL